jgi:hypothetical protein
MPRLKKPGRPGVTLMAVVSGLLLLAVIGCKSPTTTDTTSTITITNGCGAKVDVYLDGTLKVTIEKAIQGTVSNVIAGSHLIEAKTSDTGVLVASITLTIKASTNTSVSLYGPASVSITNLYGEILGIYLDDIWVGDIGDQITQTLNRITLGSHVLTAKKKTDGTVAATVTINVTDAIVYTWTITP